MGRRAGRRSGTRPLDFNVTDDAWFGHTAGPYQHFAEARLRAIEWGLPMVRSANGGLSAVIDARGRILVAAPLGAETVLDADLPGALPPTPEARWGSAFFGLALALFGLLSIAGKSVR